MSRPSVLASAPAADDTARARFAQWMVERADTVVLRAVLAILLASTAAVLALDYHALQERAALSNPERIETPTEPLPSSQPDDDPRTAPARTGDERLQVRMSFDLVEGGRLMAIGTIEPGVAQAFAAELAKRGGYVKTVVLHSPGGSVSDALEMGRLIRARKLTTEVEAGRYCASSCPLVFAGGVERRFGPKSAIGVHQISVVGDGRLTGARAMESAQRVSAECQTYLRDMGVDPQVWVLAMQTPKDRLHYLKPAELLALRLATAAEPIRGEAGARRP